jgi:hypothetical protein
MSQQQAREKYAAGYYADKLEEGLEFQDIATRTLYERGVVVVGYASRRFQKSQGENMLGAEIKHDGRFRETGNLYFETEEKAHPDRPSWMKSGIHRGDNAWLFVIGDERKFWVFSTKYLRRLERRYPKVETATSKGFLMPLADADGYCLRAIEASGE